MKKKVMVVFGTRPEAIKMILVVKACKVRQELEVKVCVTVQHRQMLDQVMDIFGLKADFDFNVMAPNQTLGDVTCKAPSLGKPVIVMRDTTERPEAVDAGTVILAGTEMEAMASAAERLLDDPDFYHRMAHTVNPYGDGLASKRIASILAEGKMIC